MAAIKSSQPYPLPIMSIQTGILVPSYRQYTPDFQNCPHGIFKGRRPRMPMSGSRHTDRVNLMQALGQQPSSCHCHHTFSYSGGNNPTADMEFVDGLTHIRTYPHLGAIYQWDHDPNFPNRRRYHAERQEVIFVSAPQGYTDKEIASFEQAQGVVLPAFLRRVYNKGLRLPSLWRDQRGNCYELEDILYLTTPKEEPKTLSAAAVIELWPTLPVAKTSGKAPFFWGEDACGNLFLTCQGNDTVYFYDHEEDTYTPVQQA